MIDRETLLGELRSLTEQRRHTLDQLARIDGAEQMCRHLLGKADQQPPPDVRPAPDAAGRLEELARQRPKLAAALAAGGMSPEECNGGD